MGIVWLGLFLSVAQNQSTAQPLKPAIEIDSTALVGIGKLTINMTLMQPVQPSGQKTPYYNIGVGIRLF